MQPEELDPGDELIAERRHVGRLPSDMAPWMRAIVGSIDHFSLWCGRVFCLLLIPMLLVMVHEVVARKLFLAPTDWAYDLSRMASGALFMLGAAYALMRGVHIRADFLYRTLSVRRQGTVDLALYLLFYFPSLILFFWVTFDYAFNSFMRNESVNDTAWMPIVWPLRFTMPIGAAMLILQGVSESLKCVYAIHKSRWP